MNILGVGGTEFIIILLIMLIVAGPKRMIHWSYILGQYLAKFRRMWAETVDVVQQEFDEAGVGIQLPKDMPTRGSLNRQAGKMLGSVTAPVKETMDQVDAEIKGIKQETATAAKTANTTVKGTNGHAPLKQTMSAKPTTKNPPRPRSSGSTASSGQGSAFGSWSNQDEKPGFGSWTGEQDDEE